MKQEIMQVHSQGWSLKKVKFFRRAIRKQGWQFNGHGCQSHASQEHDATQSKSKMTQHALTHAEKDKHDRTCTNPQASKSEAGEVATARRYYAQNRDANHTRRPQFQQAHSKLWRRR